MAAAMAKRDGGSPVTERCDSAFMGNAAERYDGAQIAHLGNGGLQERTAGSDLGWDRFVVGGNTSNRIGNSRIEER
jgi:hypothetical protein